MHIAVAFVLAIHGLIHLLGAARELRGAQIAGMSGATLIALPPPLAKAVGGLWLLSCLIFLAAALQLALQRTQWWVPAGIAVVLSQLLVVYAWPDAKAGTLVNVALALAVSAGWGAARFERDSDAAVSTL